MHAANDCIFCKIIAKQIPTTAVAENEKLIVIKDIAPAAPIHYLIIPKQHMRDVQSIEAKDLGIAQDIFAMAQRLSAEDPRAKEFRLAINNGYSAGQRVFHLHVHFLAGFESEKK